MMAEEGDRDEILANFQTTTGADFDECVAFLESSEWDLGRALNGWYEIHGDDSDIQIPINQPTQQQQQRILPIDEHFFQPQAVQTSPIMPRRVRFSAEPGSGGEEDSGNSRLSPSPNPFEALVKDSDSDEPQYVHHVKTNKHSTKGGIRHRKKQSSETASGSNAAESSNVVKNCKGVGKHKITAKYHGKEKTFEIEVEQTVGDLKNLLASGFGVAPNKFDISWERYALADGEQTKIESLNLPKNYSIDLVSRNNKVHKQMSGKRRIALEINNLETGVVETMYCTPDDTVADVKQNAYSLTGISPGRQVWQGWPPEAVDEMEINECNLNNPHKFKLEEMPRLDHPVNESGRDEDDAMEADDAIELSDTEATDDTLADLATPTSASSDMFLDAELNHEAAQAQDRLPLMPSECGSIHEALQNFTAVFEARYGALRPQFFMGTLDEVLQVALHSESHERRPLLLYLHDDNGIGSNVFCSQVLCTDQVSSLINGQFFIWGWDMTLDENKHSFFHFATALLKENSVEPLQLIPASQYPIMLIIGREKGQPVGIDLIRGTSLIDEVMEQLFNGMARFQEMNTAEIKEEVERKDRKLFREHQETEYQNSLAADRAKKEEKERQAKEEILEQRKREQEIRDKEKEMKQLSDSLPSEPAIDSKEPITTVRLRFPDGQIASRRFRSGEQIINLIKFAASKGYKSSQYRLLTSDFPKRDLTTADKTKSFMELKIPTREQVTVDERPEDS